MSQNVTRYTKEKLKYYWGKVIKDSLNYKNLYMVKIKVHLLQKRQHTATVLDVQSTVKETGPPV